MQIVNRTPSLPERGKIKIGEKGKARQSQGGKTFQPPTKLDHFIITTMERNEDGNFTHDTALMKAIAEKTGQQADKLTRLPVRLLYNDPELNFATRYAAYAGRTLWCSGNGKEALRQSNTGGGYVGVSCTCERIAAGFNGEGPRCKINGILSVLIDHAAGVGGVWKFRTTSFNSVDGLMGSLSFMAAATGGWLANLPLELVLHKKLVADPKGNQQTIYVVGLEFRGTVDALRDAGYEAALASSRANLRIEHIETEARKLIDGATTPEAVFPGEDADDVVDEFYPEDEQNEEAPALVPPGTEEAAPAEEEAAQAEPQPKKGRGRPRKNQEAQAEEAETQGASEEPPPSDEEAPPPELTPPAAPLTVDDDPIF